MHIAMSQLVSKTASAQNGKNAQHCLKQESADSDGPPVDPKHIFDFLSAHLNSGHVLCTNQRQPRKCASAQSRPQSAL